MKCSEVLKCSDGLSNKVPNIIRRHTDNVKLLLVCITGPEEPRGFQEVKFPGFRDNGTGW